MGASLQTKGGARNNRRMSEINVTPMVDVMLVLLIIFMVTAPMMTAGVAVDLPETSARPLPGKDEPLIVTVKSDGKIYLQETEIPFEQLAVKLNKVSGEKKDARIFIRGDRKLNYGRMMEVMGEIDAAGFSRVAFVTESRQSTK